MDLRSRHPWRAPVAVAGTVLALGCVSAYSGTADEAAYCQRVENEQTLEAIWDRAAAVRPTGRDSPLRYLNISDDEVREVQSAAAEVVGNVLVTIGPVTVGCPCEDGDGCTDQVWVLAHLPRETVGLSLSKVGGHWTIGTAQRWWLREGEIRTCRDHCTSSTECQKCDKAWRAHMDDFPLCGIDRKLLQKRIDESVAQCKKSYRSWHGT